MKFLKHSTSIRIEVSYSAYQQVQLGGKSYELYGETRALFLDSMRTTRANILRDFGVSVFFVVVDDYVSSPGETFRSTNPVEKILLQGILATKFDDISEMSQYSDYEYMTSKVYNVFSTSRLGNEMVFGQLFSEQATYLVYKANPYDDEFWVYNGADDALNCIVDLDRLDVQNAQYTGDSTGFVTIGKLEGNIIRSLPISELSERQKSRWLLYPDKPFIYIPDNIYQTVKDEVDTFVETLGGYQVVESMSLSRRLLNELNQGTVQTSERDARSRLRDKFERRDRERKASRYNAVQNSRLGYNEPNNEPDRVLISREDRPNGVTYFHYSDGTTEARSIYDVRTQWFGRRYRSGLLDGIYHQEREVSPTPQPAELTEEEAISGTVDFEQMRENVYGFGQAVNEAIETLRAMARDGTNVTDLLNEAETLRQPSPDHPTIVADWVNTGRLWVFRNIYRDSYYAISYCPNEVPGGFEFIPPEDYTDCEYYRCVHLPNGVPAHTTTVHEVVNERHFPGDANVYLDYDDIEVWVYVSLHNDGHTVGSREPLVAEDIPDTYVLIAPEEFNEDEHGNWDWYEDLL